MRGMKTVRLTVGGPPVFQGDVMIRRVASVPTTAVKMIGPDSRIVAHSETGHHHIVDGDLAVFGRGAGESLHVQSFAPTMEVRHLREWDTHETWCLEGGGGEVYEFVAQREHAPEGWRRVAD